MNRSLITSTALAILCASFAAQPATPDAVQFSRPAIPKPVRFTTLQSHEAWPNLVRDESSSAMADDRCQISPITAPALRQRCARTIPLIEMDDKLPDVSPSLDRDSALGIVPPDIPKIWYASCRTYLDTGWNPRID